MSAELTLKDLQDCLEMIINEKPLMGDDLIRAYIRANPVHPRAVEATKKLYDEIFGERWRTL